MTLQAVLPVAIGEFGSKFEDKLDAETMHDLAAYMGEHIIQVSFPAQQHSAELGCSLLLSQ